MMRLILCLLAAFVLIPAANAQTSEEQFRSAMIPRLAAAMPGAELSTKSGDPLAIFVKGGPLGEDGQINLDRIYRYCQTASAAECEAEKARLVAALTQTRPAATPASLRLVVRDQEYIGSIQAMTSQEGKKADSPIIQPLGGGLYAVLVSDSPDALQILMGGTVKEMGLTNAEAWALAQRQTAPLLPDMPKASELKGNAVLFAGHEFGGSLLINLPAWEKLAAEVGPDLFVTVVSDQTVFVAVMPDGPDMETVKKNVAQDCREQARCTSPFVFRFRDGHWAIAE